MSDLRISAAEAFALMRDEGYVYVDVRSATEFALGHPRGARNIAWQHDPAPATPPNPDFLAELERTFPHDAKLIVGCHSARRSALAAAAMRARGYSDVREQRGGMAGVRDAFGGLVEVGWEASGLPVER